jgi:L-rhamnose isomerase
MDDKLVESSYNAARDAYQRLGTDADEAMDRLANIAISLPCWQLDDVTGFEAASGSLGGGLAATGGHPGKATNPTEMRADLETAYSLIPGQHRLNLHAIYGEFDGQKVDRDAVGIEHFSGWLDWAKAQKIGLDFNSTMFSHDKAASGFTLSNSDKGIRAFWIEHAKRCREITAQMGKGLGSPSLHNLWIPDGSKDLPADRWTPRKLLCDSLDIIYKERADAKLAKDSVECKLFGLGSEAYVVGSHEFYMGYAIASSLMLCLDMGHFHPTESVADKISAVMQFQPELLLHMSRGVRWDSDHVVTLNDETKAVAQELVRGEVLDRVNIALDFFDASINRVGALVIGTRAVLKALLAALLEPNDRLREHEVNGDNFARLALMEEAKTLPLGAVWDYYCLKNDVPVGDAYIEKVQAYDKQVVKKRS